MMVCPLILCPKPRKLSVRFQVTYSCYASIWEVKAGRLFRVQGQPVLHSEF